MSSNGSAPGLRLPPTSRISNFGTASGPPTPSSEDLAIDRSMDTRMGPTLPPPRSSSQASVESERRASRTLASVHSILNPSNAEESEFRGRRRSAAQMEAETTQISPPTAIASMSRPSSSGGNGETSPPGFNNGSRNAMPRRILTPISPTLHRTTSLSRIVTGTIDATVMPFLSPSARIHTAEPGAAGIPPLPSGQIQQVGQRQTYSYSHAPTPPLPAPRRQSLSNVPSARASPSPSYSSYSRSGRASPAHPFPASSGPTPPGSFSLAASPVVGHLSTVPPVSLDHDQHQQHQGISLVSGGRTDYDIYSLRTSRGDVSIPVEIHVASKQADEKRKRNAGASARFRQRRKEKEREANTTIDRLREDLRDMTSERDFYRSERDRLLDVLKGSPGWERHAARSPSPMVRRRAQRAARGPTPSDRSLLSPSPQPQFAVDEDSEMNEHRRSGSHSVPHSGPSAPATAAQQQPLPSQQPSYHAPFPTYTTANGPPQHVQSQPGHRYHQQSDMQAESESDRTRQQQRRQGYGAHPPHHDVKPDPDPAGHDRTWPPHTGPGA